MPAHCSPLLPLSGAPWSEIRAEVRFMPVGRMLLPINHCSLRALGLAFQDVGKGFSGSTSIRETFMPQPIETQTNV